LHAQSFHKSRTSWLILALCLLGSCSGDNSNGAAALLPAQSNLLLITLDTTRVDRLGSYGHAAAQTPNLDEIADQGVRFERAYAHVPLTLPTHASLLTGTLPPEHGIHDNGRRALGPQLTTLAEIFRDKGYATAAFVSAIALDGSFGLNRGFEVYEDQLSTNQPNEARVLQRSGKDTTDLALEWVRQSQGPFFLWVHYYDPHSPYTPPAEFAGGDPYDGEISYMDGQIGRLLDYLDAQQIKEHTLVVAIADHGESLLEKGEHTHGSLIYDGTQRIPFMMSLPGSLPSGIVVTDPVGQADLLPTVMELYDWSVPDEVSGRSLAQAWSGSPLPSKPVWIESDYAALNFGWSPLRGVVKDQWKYIQAPTPELYDLSNDPQENTNLAQSKPEVLQALQNAMAQLEDNMGSYAAHALELDADLAQDLSGLGYAQGLTGDQPQKTLSDVNPIEHIGVLERYHEAIGHSHQGQFAKMIPPLEEVQKAFPKAAGFRTQLGDAYRRVGRLKEARSQLEEAIQLDPNYDPAHFYLGELAAVEGNPQGAIAAYRKTLALRPSYAPAKEHLAIQLAGLGRNEEALKLFVELNRTDPSNVRVWLFTADLHQRLQQHAMRLAAIERAFKADPLDLGTINLLAWALSTTQLAKLRDGPRALELAQRCVKFSSGKHPEPLLTLAAAQAECGQQEQAQASLQQAIQLAKLSRPASYVQELEVRARQLENTQSLRD
jgi:arylsulfatase A-like enzyme/Tfp pilus assembly protein PilF